MKMNKYINHFIKICKHKYYVGSILVKSGLYWQAITHDLSKFSITEFVPSAKYFSGDRSPIEAEKEKVGYSAAWLHHKGRNKHHWQYWVDYTHGKLTLCSIPEKYLYEMAADVVGASKAYLGGKYDPKEPLEYFRKHRDEWQMIVTDKMTVEFFIRYITDNNVYDLD